MSDQPQLNSNSFVSEKTVAITPKLSHYLDKYGRKSHPEVVGLREDSFNQRYDNIRMLLEPTTCTYLEHQLRTLNGIRAIEVGTFTGVTALALALSIQTSAKHRDINVVDVLDNFENVSADLPLPSEEALPNTTIKDRLAINNPKEVVKHIAENNTKDTPLMLTLDLNTSNITDVSLAGWKKSGALYSPLVFLKGPAVDTLQDLTNYDTMVGSFDMVFIDAAKSEYIQYYEHALTLLKPNGIICVDNVIWSGRVAEYALNDDLSLRSDDEKAGLEADKSTIALHEFNALVSQDPRVDAVLLPLGDGLYVCRKL